MIISLLILSHRVEGAASLMVDPTESIVIERVLFEEPSNYDESSMEDNDPIPETSVEYELLVYDISIFSLLHSY